MLIEAPDRQWRVVSHPFQDLIIYREIPKAYEAYGHRVLRAFIQQVEMLKASQKESVNILSFFTQINAATASENV